MASREITLDTAAFLDSSRAQALTTISREDQRKIIERFLGCAYDELGVAPHKLDGEGMHAILGHLLPGRFQRKDPLAAQVPSVLRAYLAHLEESKVVTSAYEMRSALEHTLDEFQGVVETGENMHHHHHERQTPFVHKASKTGRNDPCPCGSGKKFKQCHMR